MLMNRAYLVEAEVRGFITRAAERHDQVPGFADFVWSEAVCGTTTHGTVFVGLGCVGLIPFTDLIAAEDGVFLFGWDEVIEHGVWKWVPAVPAGQPADGGQTVERRNDGWQRRRNRGSGR